MSATAPVNPPTGAIVRVTVPKVEGAIEIELVDGVMVTGELPTVSVWLELAEGA